ncbi:MAG: F0F1 ATP synthase subunit I [Rhodobacteraceae bacterium]|nr:F0F1 ATP synthase subunit I [Paracoccaceae bacterium]
MSDNPDPDRLKALAEKLEVAQAVPVHKKHDAGKYSGAGPAWQMVVELTTGMAIGVILGLALDSWTGLAPLFIVVFTLLGFAAGVRVMMQTATAHQKKAEAKALAEKK